jgi:hypothetical protein
MMRNDLEPNPNEATRSLTWGLVLAAAAVAITLRVLPYATGSPWLFGFWCIGGLGLFAGARLRAWQGIAVPLLTMAVSDLAIRAYVPFTFLERMPVYASILLYVLLGRTLQQTRSPWRIGGAALLGSLQFFLITNFALFATSTVDPATIPDGAAWHYVTEPGFDWPVLRYARNFAGLLACYGLALPFAWKTLLSDLGFASLLFGAHAWLSRAAFARKVAAPQAAGR